MRALAVQFVAPRQVAIVETDVPQPKAGEVLVRTLFSGISSGSELLAYRGEIPADLHLDETIQALDGTFSYPFHYGYSSVGVVEDSNARVAPGTLVFGFHPHQSSFVISEDEMILIPGIDPRQATLFPLVETALQITLDAGPMMDELVVVMGMGTVGMITALLLQRSGARVLGVDPIAWRRRLGAELDIDVVGEQEAAERVNEATDGAGVPLVVEVSGNPRALANALPLLAHEGTALVASWYGSKPATLSLGGEFHRRRLTVRSTQVSTIPARLSQRWTLERRRERVVQLLETLPLKPLATHEFPFLQAVHAFAAIDRAEEGLMHAALNYQGR